MDRQEDTQGEAEGGQRRGREEWQRRGLLGGEREEWPLSRRAGATRGVRVLCGVEWVLRDEVREAGKSERVCRRVVCRAVLREIRPSVRLDA